jgi:hypothetical protein
MDNVLPWDKDAHMRVFPLLLLAVSACLPEFVPTVTSHECPQLTAVPDLDDSALTPRPSAEAESFALECSNGAYADTALYERIRDDLAAIRAFDARMATIVDHRASTMGSVIAVDAPTVEDARAFAQGEDPTFRCVMRQLSVVTLEWDGSSTRVYVNLHGLFDGRVLKDVFAPLLVTPLATYNFHDGSQGYADALGPTRTYVLDQAGGDCPAGCTTHQLFLWEVTGTSTVALVDQWDSQTQLPMPNWALLREHPACNKCDGRVVPAGTQEQCADGVDNDCNGLVDCADAACARASRCLPEVCDNHVDDNENGATDCDDTSCAWSTACGGLTCGSPLDRVALERLSGLGPRWNVTRDMLACAQQSRAVSTCVAEGLAVNGFSTGCAGCMGGLAQCSAEGCRAPCQDPGAAECISCQVAQCEAPLTACLGESAAPWFER